MPLVHPGPDRSARGYAGGDLRIGVPKAGSACCQVIEAGCLKYRMSFSAQAIPAHMITYDKNDVWSVVSHNIIFNESIFVPDPKGFHGNMAQMCHFAVLDPGINGYPLKPLGSLASF